MRTCEVSGVNPLGFKKWKMDGYDIFQHMILMFLNPNSPLCARVLDTCCSGGR